MTEETKTKEVKTEQTVNLDLEAVKQFLDTEDGKQLIESSEAVRGIINKRNELLGEKDKWAEKWRKYEDLGEYDTLKQALEAYAKQNNKDTKSTDDEIDPGLLDTLRTQIQEKDQALNQFKQNYLNTQVDASIDSAITEAKGNSRLLKHIVKERVKSSLSDDGKVVVEVLTKDGKKMFRNDESPATLSDLLAELRNDEDLGSAFASSGANGSGTRPNSGKGVGGVILDRNDPNFDYTAAMKYYAKHGFKKQ